MKQALRELSRRKKPWLIAIAVLVALNIASFAVSALYQAPALARKLDTLKKIATSDRGGAGGTFVQGKKDLERMQAMIPSRRRFPYILGELMDAAASSSVTAGDVTYTSKEVKEQKMLRRYEVNLTVSGKYGAVKLFLSELQAKEGLVHINNVKLSNDDPYTEKVAIEVQLILYLKDDA